jgi:N-acyl-D-aspartate/D-glutamate deacylase
MGRARSGEIDYRVRMRTTLRILAVLLAITAAVCTARAQEGPYDLLIRGGRIVDGTGNPAFPPTSASAATASRPLDDWRMPRATREIDARGLVVAPGFIDLHTHSDLPLINDGNARARSGRA